MFGRHRQTAGTSAPEVAQEKPANTAPYPTARPQFAQPEPLPDPAKFAVKHASDAAAYKEIDTKARAHELRPLPFPRARRHPREPVLTLNQVLGSDGDAVTKAIEASGQIVFHAVGDTGNTRSTDPQNEVSDKMAGDFEETDKRDAPQFCLHLGDVVYSFGEAQYYYDQFYEPYRNYPAPIVALAGNHDGMLAPGANVATLEAFLTNFCAENFVVTPEAGGLDRTAMIQPGVYFTFEAPFVRVIALYSNTLEDPGVISSQGGQFPEVTDVQLDFLKAALTRIRDDKYAGAVLIAHHHPVFTAGSRHSWSPKMLKEIDGVCESVGVWPHAVLSAHAHNYQRFTRAHGGRQVPYLVAGNGGHGRAPLQRKGGKALRVPQVIEGSLASGESVVLESYDDQDYGYLRIIATATQLRIEYHPASDGDGAKTPDDSATVDLRTRQLVHFSGTARHH